MHRLIDHVVPSGRISPRRIHCRRAYSISTRYPGEQIVLDNVIISNFDVSRNEFELNFEVDYTMELFLTRHLMILN